jgi:hypothetical protein
MDPTLMEHLLWQDESETLDFKEGPYEFGRVAEEDRAELLKDILGFANAWRSTEAYILIGVRHIRGERSLVVGISPDRHIPDHSLQQFVRSYTDQPVNFRYEATTGEELPIGVIWIDRQTRPIRLTKNIGALKRGDVYVRRGSTTDPTRPASEHEIARMIMCSRPRQAELAVEFGDLDDDVPIGASLEWQTEACRMPSQIPDLRPQRERGIMLPYTGYDINQNYYRDLAEYVFLRRVLRATRLVVRNVGPAPATTVRLEIAIPKDEHTLLRYDVPSVPRTSRLLMTPSFRSARREPGDIEIVTKRTAFHVRTDCADLQPRRPLYTEPFYIGRTTSGDIVLNVVAYANTLERPESFSLTIHTQVLQTSMSLDELSSLPEEEEE